MNLFEAIRANMTDEVCSCLAKHKDMANTRNPDTGITLLMMAANAGNPKIVKALIEAGADINKTDEKGRTALHHACDVKKDKGDIETLEILLNAGANIEAMDKLGETALHKACKGYRSDLAEVFAKSGADLSATDFKKETPLHEAVRGGNAKLVDVLMKHYADPYAHSEDLNTPVHDAIIYGQKEALEVLLKHGITLDETNQHDFTPLHTAAMLGKTEMAEMLIKAGANVNSTGKLSGKTPLDVAMGQDSKNKQEMIDLLRKAGGHESKIEPVSQEKEQPKQKKSLLARLRDAVLPKSKETSPVSVAAIQFKNAQQKR